MHSKQHRIPEMRAPKFVNVNGKGGCRFQNNLRIWERSTPLQKLLTVPCGKIGKSFTPSPLDQARKKPIEIFISIHILKRINPPYLINLEGT
jgi:hypothetical protein